MGVQFVTRRTHISLLATAALGTAFPAAAKENGMFQQILEASQSEKKGIMLYVKGHQIGGVVVKISGDSVELRSREYSRIVVRVEAIDAAALA
jgi:hypothetical protein